MADYSRFYRAMADVYRAERERSDKCLTDIVNIICACPESADIQKIAERLMAHYERRDALPSGDQTQ